MIIIKYFKSFLFFCCCCSSCCFQCDSIKLNSSNEIEPFPSKSTDFIMFFNSSGVYELPNDFIAISSSSTVM